MGFGERGSVHQGEAFLLLERELGQAGRPQGFASGHLAPFVHHLALADERKREVALRDEVAARGEAALLRHDRQEFVVEQLEQKLRQGWAYSRIALRHDVGLEQQHSSHDLRGNRRPGSHRVTQHRVPLDRPDQLGGQRADAVRAVACVDAVHPDPVFQLSQQRVTETRHAGDGCLRQARDGMPHDNRLVVVQRKRAGPHHDHIGSCAHAFAWAWAIGASRSEATMAAYPLVPRYRFARSMYSSTVCASCSRPIP